MREIRHPVETGEGRLLQERIAAAYQKVPSLPHVIRGYDDESVQQARRLQVDPSTMPNLPKGFDDDIIRHTVKLRDKVAVNYRNFLVGVCGVALVNGEPVIIDAANDSPERAIPRNCGEMGVMAKLLDLHRIFGDVVLKYLYIAAPSDPNVLEETVGFRFPVLPPCDECRDMFTMALREVPDIVSPDVELAMIAPETGIVVRDALGSLLGSFKGFIPPLSSERELAMAGVIAESPTPPLTREGLVGAVAAHSIASFDYAAFSPGGLMVTANVYAGMAMYN